MGRRGATRTRHMANVNGTWDTLEAARNGWRWCWDEGTCVRHAARVCERGAMATLAEVEGRRIGGARTSARMNVVPCDQGVALAQDHEQPHPVQSNFAVCCRGSCAVSFRTVMHVSQEPQFTSHMHVYLSKVVVCYIHCRHEKQPL